VKKINLLLRVFTFSLREKMRSLEKLKLALQNYFKKYIVDHNIFANHQPPILAL